MTARRPQNRVRLVLLALVVILVIGLLAGTYLLTSKDESEGETRVTLFLSFIPSVQFAPVYVAAERGYFADEGIAITLEHGSEPDGLERIATGDLRFGLISGEQVILARANGRPVVYIFEWYERFPVGVVAPVDAGISAPADLAGRVVGVPGPFGASYIGLRALLKAGGLTEDDLAELRSIGFAAPDSVCAGEVEAAAVYIANEPLTIEQQCTDVVVIPVSDYATLVANGLVTNEQTIADDPDLVRGMARAIRRGLEATFADPDAAFTISVENYARDLPQDEYDTQRQVLDNSIALWRSDRLGETDPAAWEATQAILIETGFIDAPLDDLSASYDMRFLPGD
ncbi:MAG: ABC transporter substrate-binding protein [Chloroflexi bacterium]|nr:ABC transporter substrate-binding protein [Chloroflexota bacterium]